MEAATEGRFQNTAGSGITTADLVICKCICAGPRQTCWITAEVVIQPVPTALALNANEISSTCTSSQIMSLVLVAFILVFLSLRHLERLGHLGADMRYES